MHNERPKDQFLLHRFIEYDSLFWCKCMIFFGADVNKPGPVRNWIEPVFPLWWAIYKEANIKIIKLLLKHGADPNCYDIHFGSTPLLALCIVPNHEKTRLLLSYNADITLKGRNGCSFLNNYIPPRIFTQEDKTFLNEMFQLCVDNGVDVNTKNNIQEIPIHLACTGGNLYLIKYLLDHGADVNISTIAGEIALHEFLNMKYHGKYASFIENGIANAIDCLRLLIKGTVDINAKSFDGHSPLHSLCQKPYEISTTFYNVMVTSGADPHQLSAHGSNILHTLSRSHPIGRVRESADLDNFVKAILHDGVDINGEDFDGRTPLMLAISNVVLTFVPILLNNGADVNHTDKNKRSALHYFVMHSFGNSMQIEILEWLMRYNVDVFLKDVFEKTAIGYVRNISEENNTILEYLSGKKTFNKQTKELLYLTEEKIDFSFSDFTSSCLLINHLLSTPYIGPADICQEYKTVCTQVELLISRLVKVMNINSLVFQFTPKLSGSVSENTKVGFPNEFDYLFTVNNVHDFIESKECEPGFVYLKKKDGETSPEVFDSFFDENGIFKRLDFVLYFIRLVIESLQSKKLWDDLDFYLDFQEYDRLYYWSELDMKATNQLISRPNFILYLLFPVNRFNGLWPVSIDLVPAIEIDIKCPRFLVTGSPDVKTKEEIYAVPKEISDYLSVEESEKGINRMRISTSTMEMKIFNDVPESVKKVYIVLKILCQKSRDIGTYEIKNEWFRLLENLMANGKFSSKTFESEWSNEPIMEYVMQILIKMEIDNFGKEKGVFSFFFPSMRIVKKLRNRATPYLKGLITQLSEMDFCMIEL